MSKEAMVALAVVGVALAALVWLAWSEHHDGMRRELDDIETRRDDSGG